MSLAGRLESDRMEQVQCYIGIRGAANSSQFADVPLPQMELYQKHWWQPVHSQVRITKTKWVVLRYPTDSFAQAAKMSTPAFEDFYFDVCTADYAAMEQAQKPLVARMEKADRVRPSSSGPSQRSCCAAVPKRDSSSMLPVSGAEQLKTSGARNGLRPMISQRGAYCMLVRPAP